MKRVAASEFELLTITRALFARPDKGRPSAVITMLRQKRALPPGLGPTALALMRDTMAKGLVLAMAGRGGWRPGESPRRGAIIRGRLWTRHQPPALQVSPFAMALCRWLTAQPLRSTECEPLTVTPATVADEFLLYLALDLAHRCQCAGQLSEQPAVRASALCWLGFADVLASGSEHISVPPADISVYGFVPWTSGTGVVLLEALQSDLTRLWARAERDKRRIGDPERLLAVGRVQDAVLRAYFGAIQGAERRDLCRFLVASASQLIDERRELDAWRPLLSSGGNLQSRNDAHRASVAMLRNLRTIKHWSEQASGVRFFDDEYQVAQLFLRVWEVLGENRYRRAMAIVSAVESIDGLVPS